MKVEFMKLDHKQYLDDLRETGITNMFGARPYIVSRFKIEKSTAGKILSEWMKSYGQEIEYKEEHKKKDQPQLVGL